MVSQNSNSFFSGMEGLGFNDVKNLNIYKEKEETSEKEKNNDNKSEDKKIMDLLFDRELVCPVCDTKLKVRAVKTSAARMAGKDSDFFIRYSVIDPYFYDVWLCNSCGYAAMKRDFESIKTYQIEKVKAGITTKWRGRDYPQIYNLDIAIERYKLSLLNAVVIEAKNSAKAMNCLKIAWMYRLKEDYENETLFLHQALEGFNNAYFNEDFPLYSMDRFTTMYLIGELNRRVGKNDEAVQWFSKVVTTPNVSQKLKDMARDQKDLIANSDKSNEDNMTDIVNDQEKKKGLFSFFFKK